jgi:hypothetical protein
MIYFCRRKSPGEVERERGGLSARFVSDDEHGINDGIEAMGLVNL